MVDPLLGRSFHLLTSETASLARCPCTHHIAEAMKKTNLTKRLLLAAIADPGSPSSADRFAETDLHPQLENMLRILAIRLTLPYACALAWLGLA